MECDIFEAARSGNLETVKAHLARGANAVAWNKYGFTPLHCAAMACNTVSEPVVLEIIEILLQAGSPVNLPSSDGRTALYLAAEFSRSVEPVKRLIQAGGDPNIRNRHGGHIVVNAMTPEVKKYLSDLTGHPIPPPRMVREKVKLDKTAWKSVKVQIAKVFVELSKSGLITLQDAGTTQEDGYSDCVEEFHARGGEKSGIHGFCFYTRQDQNRAKSTSHLFLGFWGAPDGAPEPMFRVGKLVVETFRKNGFIVDWNGMVGDRPMVYLQKIGDLPETENQPPIQFMPPPKPPEPAADECGL